jgi:ankyrin repeat protein
VTTTTALPAAAAAPPPAAPAPAPAPTLQQAADAGDVTTIRQLLSSPGASVDAPDSFGRTALMHAVLAQHPAAVRALLAAGADPNRADRAGFTPRAAAQTGGNSEIVQMLGPASH